MKPLVISAAVCLLALCAAVVARADSPGLSRGDAEARINAAFTGGDAIRFLGGGQEQGAPAGGPDFGSARISALPAFNGHHVCATSWHPVLAFFVAGGDSTFTRDDADANLPFAAQYTLDGATLETKLNPIKPVVDPSTTGFEVAYWNAAGAILSPDTLPVGTHTIQLTLETPGGTVVGPAVTFYVDGTGTGACL